MKTLPYLICAILCIQYTCVYTAYESNKPENDSLVSLMDFHQILDVPRETLLSPLTFIDNKAQNTLYNLSPDPTLAIHAAFAADVKNLEKFIPYWGPWPAPALPDPFPISAWHTRLNPEPKPHVWGSCYEWEKAELKLEEVQDKSQEMHNKAHVTPKQKEEKVKNKNTRGVKTRSCEQCGWCNDIFATVKVLAQHIIQSHWAYSQNLPQNNTIECEMPYECRKCKKRFDNRCQARFHAENRCDTDMQTRKKVIQEALKCALIMTGKQQDKQQAKSDNCRSYPFTCGLCTTTCTTLNRLGLHIIQNHWCSAQGLPSNDTLQCQAPYECLGCQKRFHHSGVAKVHTRHECRSGVKIPDGILNKARVTAQKMNPGILYPVIYPHSLS